MSFMGIMVCGMTPITTGLQILVSSIDQQGRLKNMWGVKVTQGKGLTFTSGPGAGMGELPSSTVCYGSTWRSTVAWLVQKSGFGTLKEHGLQNKEHPMTQEDEVQLTRQIEQTKLIELANNEVMHKLREIRKIAMRGVIVPGDVKWLVRELIIAADFRAEVLSDWLAADEAQLNEGQNGG